MNQTRINERGFAARCASAIVCFALLLLGASTSFAAPPANDNFANATVFTGNIANGTNVEATRETGEPTTIEWPGNARTTAGNASVWWRWTAPATETVTFTTGPDSTFDTQLGVYTGSLGSLTEIASNEDHTDFSGGKSKVTFNAVSGTQYYIMVNGYESITGNIVLRLTSGGVTPPPPTGFALTVNTSGNGTVAKNPDKTSYDTNEVVTLTATPTGTNTFLGWGGAAAAEGTNNPISITMDAAKTVVANFTTTGTGGGNTNATITVIVNGNGRVTPDLNGRTDLVIGQTYTLTATPSARNTFTGWTGFTNTTNRRITFVMAEGLVITANFAPRGGGGGGTPDVFAPVVGTYNGLFHPTNSLSPDCSGSFNLKVRKGGKFTLKLISGGRPASGSGQLDSNGAATVSVGRGPSAATVQLQTDMTGGSDVVTGTVSRLDCSAELIGDRQIFSARDHSPLQGTYTIVFPRNATNEVVFDTNGVAVATNTVVISQGHGYAVLTVDRNGRARIRGVLADGSRINQTTTISKTGQVPLHISLYRGQGHLIGWLNVNATDVTGTVNWQRPAGGLVFPEGLDADIEVVGSRFDRSQNPTISLNDPLLEIGGNGFVANGEVPLIIDLDAANNKTLVGTGDNENRVSLRALPTGLVRGKFVSSVTGKNTVMQGVVLQNVNAAYGFYLSSGARGYFQVSDPVVPVEPPVVPVE